MDIISGIGDPRDVYTCLDRVPHNKNNIFHCEPPELSLYPIQLIYNSLADRCQRQFYPNLAFVLNASSPP